MALLGQLTSSSSFDDVAEAIIREAVRRGYSHVEQVAVTATGIQESYLKPGATSANGLWVGIYQQDGGYTDRDNPNANIQQFLDRLDVKRRSSGASPDIWKNIFWLQQRPGERSADIAFANGRQAYLTEIQSRTALAESLVESLVDKYGNGGGVVVPDNRPDFNEYPIWSDNCQPRGNTKIDLFLLHTEEGNSNADSLAKWLNNNGVSYHYTISTGYPNDDGVTVVDVVDTDYASWSVGDANNRSINLCFAGSKASWTRDEWLTHAGRAIDVAAYLAVQDCKKYGIPLTILGFGGDYPVHGAGISDHRYVTDVIGWGTHTDVGPGFPGDVFAAAVAKYANQDAPDTPDQPAGFVYPSTDEMIKQIWEQLFGYQAKGFPALFGMSQNPGDNRGKFTVEAIGDLHKAAA